MSQERQEPGGGIAPNKETDAIESDRNIFSASRAAVHAVEHALISDASGAGVGKGGETSSGVDLSRVPRKEGGGCSINIGELEARDLAVSAVLCGQNVRGTIMIIAIISRTLHSKTRGSSRLHDESNVQLK